jgi:8-oxo-dGTP pyrophosphatase MutT (NUDIX family)
VKHGTLQDAAAIIRVRENLVYADRFIAVYDDDVRFADGRPGTYIRIAAAGGHPGAAMLPLAGGCAGLVRVYRYPVAAWEWGIPRGHAHGGDPAVTARAELAEELGAAPAMLTSLGRVHPDSGCLAGVVYLFAARYGRPVSAPRDTGEVAAVRWVPVPELMSEIAGGGITDGFTLAAVCAAMCRGLL